MIEIKIVPPRLMAKKMKQRRVMFNPITKGFIIRHGKKYIELTPKRRKVTPPTPPT